jgi:hypothetical protein
MTMLGKILVIAGGLLLVLGSLGIGGAILKSLDSVRFTGSAGIGAVGGGLELALIGAVVSVIGLLLLAAGVVIFVVNSNRSTNDHLM